MSVRFRTAVVACVTVLGTLTVAPPAAAATPSTAVYVAPYGSDTNPGTSLLRPVRSPQRARDLVRTLDQAMTRDIAVYLLPGTYRLTEPLTLDTRDAGTGGHTVRWIGVPGATVLSGGTRLTGWHPTGTAGLWSAPAPSTLDTRQLYVNGTRAQRASGPVPVALTATDAGYTASADTMAGWRNPNRIEFVYTGGDGYWNLHTGGEGGWTEPRCPVGAITGTTITMAQPCWDNSTKRVNRTDGSGRTVNLVGPSTLGNRELPMYAENAYELLDQPGEWYLDPTARTVYYRPRRGEDLRFADVEAPALQTLLSGTGVHDVAFSGIQFSYATWLAPSTAEGFSEIQATYTITGPTGYATQGLCQFVAGGTCPYGAWTKTPGNVSLDHSQRVSFVDDAFTHLGAAGLDLGDGTQDATVRGSVFTDISANGLELGGVDNPLPATTADRTSGNQIVDNHLYALPVDYHGGVAVDVGYAERTTIAHNQIDHTAYTAISLGWGGWPDKISQPATPNYSHDNLVADNLIEDPMQVLADGAGIYTQGITGTSLADGEHLTGNVIQNSLGHGHAIYTDNGATYITIDGNVEVGNENDWGARHTDYTPGHSGSDPTAITNNYWQQGDADANSGNVVLAGNRIIAGLRDAPRSIVDAAGLEGGYRLILAERFGTPAAPDAPELVTAFGAAGSGYVAWNPTFVDHGAPVTGYTVTASPGGATTTISAQDFQRLGYAVVRSLTDGTAYTFTVQAVNAVGPGPASLPSAAVVPDATSGAVPGTPGSFRALPGQNAVSLHWTPPSAVGGTPIVGYTISGAGIPTTSFTGHTAVWANSSRDIFTTVGGLKQLTPYTFKLSAVNLAGASAPVSTGTVILAPTTACAGATLSADPHAALAHPGTTVTVTETLTNGCAGTLHQASLYLFAPDGYGVTGSPVSVGDVAPGAAASASFTVSVPATATSTATLIEQAVFTGEAGGAQGLRTTSAVNVPAPSLAAAYGNTGITDDTAVGLGNVDGAGSSFSAQALASVGLVAGGPVSYGGITFSWPSGHPDNAVASGQAFDLTGTGGTLGFLVTATYGPATGAGRVMYTDGTTQAFTLTSPDWVNAGTATNVVATAPYRNRPTGKDAHAVHVYFVAVPLTAGKTVAGVVLPDVSDATPATHVASLHVFAAAIG